MYTAASFVRRGEESCYKKPWLSKPVLMLARAHMSVCLPKLETACRDSTIYQNECRSKWLRGLRPSSTAACQLRLWVRTPPGAGMFVGVTGMPISP